MPKLKVFFVSSMFLLFSTSNVFAAVEVKCSVGPFEVFGGYWTPYKHQSPGPEAIERATDYANRESKDKAKTDCVCPPEHTPAGEPSCTVTTDPSPLVAVVTAFPAPNWDKQIMEACIRSYIERNHEPRDAAEKACQTYQRNSTRPFDGNQNQVATVQGTAKADCT